MPKKVGLIDLLNQFKDILINHQINIKISLHLTWVSQHLWGFNEGVLSNEITKATRQMSDTDCWYWFGLVHICLFCRQNPLSPIQRSWWQGHPWFVPLHSLCSVWPRRVWEGQTFSHSFSSTLPRSPCNEQNEGIWKRRKIKYVSQKCSYIYNEFWKRTATWCLVRGDGLPWITVTGHQIVEVSAGDVKSPPWTNISLLYFVI